MINSQEFTRENWKAEFFSFDEFVDDFTGHVIVASGFIDEADMLRGEYGHPLIVTDGCRSDEKIDWLIRRGYAASRNSFHLMLNEKYQCSTCAMDVARPPGPLLRGLIQHALALEWTVGLGKTFVHLDRRAKYSNMPATFYSYHG